MRSRPSHATVVAYLALFVALGGTAGALAGKNSVDSRDIKPKNVRASDLAKGAVGTPKIKDSAVTSAKIKGNAVTAAKVLDGAIGSAELADGSVGPGKLDVSGTARTLGSIPVTGGGSHPLGPAINLDFPPGAVAIFWAQADIGTSNNNTNCRLEATIGNGDVFLLEADPDSGNPPIPFHSALEPVIIESGVPTGQVTVRLTASLNGVTTNTCTYVNPQLLGFVVN